MRTTEVQTKFQPKVIEKPPRNSFVSKQSSELWGIILAGGDGMRLRSLTRLIAGDERPKQFCRLLGRETMLAQTRRRIARKISPEKTVFVLTQKHKPFYAPILSGVSPERMVIQPENRGTAAAILYALLRLSILAPGATAAIFPSDHYVADEGAFMDYVEAAYQKSGTRKNSVILLGIEPDNPETEYGWIEGVSESDEIFARVNCFWEKPSSQKAQKLFQAGCLWNSFVMVGKISAFFALFAQTLPEFYAELASVKYLMNTIVEKPVLYGIYQQIRAVNFSREILEAHPELLLVMRVKGVGWNDLGQPRRVFHTINSLDSARHRVKTAG